MCLQDDSNQTIVFSYWSFYILFLYVCKTQVKVEALLNKKKKVWTKNKEQKVRITHL